MTNHNHLLGKIQGVDGLKTGFTDGAGFCLAATASRNGRRIIVVMMDSPDSRTRDLNVQELITQAFVAEPLATKPFGPEKPGISEPTRPAPTPVGTPTPSAAGGPTISYPGLGKK